MRENTQITGYMAQRQSGTDSHGSRSFSRNHLELLGEIVLASVTVWLQADPDIPEVPHSSNGG